MPTFINMNGKKGGNYAKYPVQLFRLLEYIYGKAALVGGQNIDLSSWEKIYDDMMMTKRLMGKQNGVLFQHFVVSFHNEDKINTNTVSKIVEDFIKDKKFEGYEILYGVHDDTDNFHAHILINSVNSVNGKKFHLSTRETLQFAKKINKIGLEYNCSVPESIAREFDIDKNIIIRKTRADFEMKKFSNTWIKKSKNIIENLISNSFNFNDLKANAKSLNIKIYKNKQGKFIADFKDLTRKIGFDKLEIYDEDIQNRFDFNNRLDPREKIALKENLLSLSNKDIFNTKLDELEEFLNPYEYAGGDKNIDEYYKDLSISIRDLIENHMFYDNYEKRLAAITKYTLNTSNTIQDAVEKLNSLDFECSIFSDNHSIIFDFGKGNKVSSEFLEINLDKELRRSASWKYDLFQNVKIAKNSAKSKEEFIEILNFLGVKTLWTDKRQYITFTDIYGNKRRNNKLYPEEDFTKSSLIESFKKNKETLEKKKYEHQKKEDISKIKFFVFSSLKNCTSKTDFNRKLQEENAEYDFNKKTFDFNGKKYDVNEIFHQSNIDVEKIIENNQNQYLAGLNYIFRLLRKDTRRSYSYRNQILRSLDSLVDRKDFIAEMKKGRGITERAR